jgi:hypothetical protein
MAFERLSQPAVATTAKQDATIKIRVTGPRAICISAKMRGNSAATARAG